MRKGIRITSLLIVLTLLLVLSVRWAERNERLNLTVARIDNSSLLDSAQIAGVLKPYFGVSVLKLNRDSLEAQFLALDGVDSVSVSIHYPDMIVVSLKTGEPAAILAYLNGQVPVTAEGQRLPLSWVNDSLPVINIEGSPKEEAVSSALNFLIKRNLRNSVSIQVNADGIAVLDNGIRVMIDYRQTTVSWLRWQVLKTAITGQPEEVDLRYTGQAVLRFAEET
jgi:cell division septal protein FtsQ